MIEINVVDNEIVNVQFKTIKEATEWLKQRYSDKPEEEKPEE